MVGVIYWIIFALNTSHICCNEMGLMKCLFGAYETSLFLGLNLLNFTPLRVSSSIIVSDSDVVKGVLL